MNQMIDKLKLKKKIAKHEEEIEWLKQMLKRSEDNLFCAKAELEEKQNDNQSSA
tara:strand:- start:11 stop:172 length:162 start_codon:yes stop_codon:yes gene_type:complete